MIFPIFGLPDSYPLIKKSFNQESHGSENNNADLNNALTFK